MELYYKELLENKEELEKKIANVKDEDTVDLITNLNMLRSRAGANHPLTIAYEKEFNKRQTEWVQKEIDNHERRQGK